MERTPTTMLRIGTWCVNPTSGQISRDGESARLEARTMRLLVCLAEHAGEVVSIDDLLSQVWSGVIVSSDSVYQAVASLRRLLGDDPKQPTYIATVPRLGYRMVATVSPWVEEPMVQPVAPMASSAAFENEASVAIASAPRLGSRRIVLMVSGAVICLVVAFAFLLRVKTPKHRTVESATVAASQTQKSIAVLPFLDLTQGMHEGEFADGMTEELIDKLSKLPKLQVPSPTASFYYRDKEMPVADIAKALGVVYVLDGSVRKSGARVRVAARLIRADNGYVVWSETYDRPFHDLLMVQDDIAGEVTKALGASTEFKAS
ncbi:winged helix-turn-helix domain-containing protein [Tunturiibacter empetritectus]|uniref:TolB-like protein/DNA-binding winged helix-turn-helix (WHTH) protein n=1 Tax=Tunturiibacter lichenicola TaxID=2051959 RepID=A0A852VHD1_9BACT|nr:winged helix-turn-helix domain-containing protein [Edaphobacter lichenicola]NYF89615.1 TolB-like protein/DNA-binding winged helix-turn-helix (wHTH) protein [Edaphobacter lichenicola]